MRRVDLPPHVEGRPKPTSSIQDDQDTGRILCASDFVMRAKNNLRLLRRRAFDFNQVPSNKTAAYETLMVLTRSEIESAGGRHLARGLI